MGEKAARSETATAKFAELKPVFGEIYANPAVTQKALDDLFFNVESELAADIAIQFAEQEGPRSLPETGRTSPRGCWTIRRARKPTAPVRSVRCNASRREWRMVSRLQSRR